MKTTVFSVFLLASFFCFGFFFKSAVTNEPVSSIEKVKSDNDSKQMYGENMKLGAFSLSLNVKDIKASKEFYENLGFTVFGGNINNNYLIMKNENTLIGLFQGMFDKNMLTFNPGWDENAKNIENFDDIREIQKKLKSRNIKLITEADENTSGPASLMLTDPDGNIILVDQHR